MGCVPVSKHCSTKQNAKHRGGVQEVTASHFESGSSSSPDPSCLKTPKWSERYIIAKLKRKVAAYIIKGDPKNHKARILKDTEVHLAESRPQISACNQHGHSTEYAQ
jgi:hypothetical protein